MIKIVQVYYHKGIILNLLTKKFVDDLNDTNVNDLLTKCHFRDKKYSKIQYNDMKNVSYY